MKIHRLIIATTTALGFSVGSAASAQAHDGGAYGGYPFPTDVIYVKNIPGQSEDNWALNRLEAAGIDIRWVDYNPAHGINFVPDSTLVARKGWAAYAAPTWTARWSMDHWEWQTSDCTITYQTGYPSRKRQFIFAHEAMHCFGHMNHVDSSSALMRQGTKGWDTYYTARSWEIDRLRALYRLNY